VASLEEKWKTCGRTNASTYYLFLPGTFQESGVMEKPQSNRKTGKGKVIWMEYLEVDRG
jgi:hypothetical protein